MMPHKNVREMLDRLGVGQFNATMIIPYMMIAPATTDPKSSQIYLLVQHIQRALYAMGYDHVAESGELDDATSAALRSVAGPDWEIMPWSASVGAVVDAQMHGLRAPPPPMLAEPVVALAGPLDFLPDVPGGVLTYAVAAYFAYRYFTRK